MMLSTIYALQPSEIPAWPEEWKIFVVGNVFAMQSRARLRSSWTSDVGDDVLWFEERAAFSPSQPS
jgi:hypothetical protein